MQEIENEREKVYAAKLKADAEEYKLELQKEKELKYQKMAELNKEVRKEYVCFIYSYSTKWLVLRLTQSNNCST